MRHSVWATEGASKQSKGQAKRRHPLEFTEEPVIKKKKVSHQDENEKAEQPGPGRVEYQHSSQALAPWSPQGPSKLQIPNFAILPNPMSPMLAFRPQRIDQGPGQPARVSPTPSHTTTADIDFETLQYLATLSFISSKGGPQRWFDECSDQMFRSGRAKIIFKLCRYGEELKFWRMSRALIIAFGLHNLHGGDQKAMWRAVIKGISIWGLSPPEENNWMSYANRLQKIESNFEVGEKSCQSNLQLLEQQLVHRTSVPSGLLQVTRKIVLDLAHHIREQSDTRDEVFAKIAAILDRSDEELDAKTVALVDKLDEEIAAKTAAEVYKWEEEVAKCKAEMCKLREEAIRLGREFDEIRTQVMRYKRSMRKLIEDFERLKRAVPSLTLPDLTQVFTIRGEYEDQYWSDVGIVMMGVPEVKDFEAQVGLMCLLLLDVVFSFYPNPGGPGEQWTEYDLSFRLRLWMTKALAELNEGQ